MGDSVMLDHRCVPSASQSLRTTPRVGPGLVLILALLAMIGPFTIDTIFPGFAAMERDLQVSSTAMQQVISVYLVTLAVMSLLHGPLSDAAGRRPVIIGSCLGFALASVGCAVAPDFGVLLVMRALQGVFAGAGTIVGRAMIRDLLEASAAQRLLSQVTMVFGAAPAVAPIVGGALIPWGWRSIFWFLVVLGAGLTIMAALLLPESLPPQDRAPFAPRRIIGSVLGRFADPASTRLAIAIGLNFGAMFLYIASAPAFVQGILGLGEQDYWTLFVPLIGGMVVGSYVSGRLSGRLRPGQSATLGLTISLLAGGGNVLYALWPRGVPDTVHLPWAVVGPSICAFGIALAFPVMILRVIDRAPHARGAAASVQSFTQLILQAALTSFLSPQVSDSPRALAVSALLLTAAAAGLWAWEVLRGRRVRAAQREISGPEPITGL